MYTYLSNLILTIFLLIMYHSKNMLDKSIIKRTTQTTNAYSFVIWTKELMKISIKTRTLLVLLVLHLQIVVLRNKSCFEQPLANANTSACFFVKWTKNLRRKHKGMDILCAMILHLQIVVWRNESCLVQLLKVCNYV